jgi:hypothetical protein
MRGGHGYRGRADLVGELQVAKELGLDVDQLQKDAEDPDIKKALDEAKDLANKLNLKGTPLYLIGDRVVSSAPTSSTSSRPRSPRSGRRAAQAPADGPTPELKSRAIAKIKKSGAQNWASAPAQSGSGHHLALFSALVSSHERLKAKILILRHQLDTSKTLVESATG